MTDPIWHKNIILNLPKRVSVKPEYKIRIDNIKKYSLFKFDLLYECHIYLQILTIPSNTIRN